MAAGSTISCPPRLAHARFRTWLSLPRRRCGKRRAIEKVALCSGFARTVVLAKFCFDRHLPSPATTPSAGSSLNTTSRRATASRGTGSDPRAGVVAPIYVDLATPELRGGHDCRGEQRLQGLMTGYFEPASEIIGHSRVAFSAAVRSSLFSALR